MQAVNIHRDASRKAWLITKRVYHPCLRVFIHWPPDANESSEVPFTIADISPPARFLISKHSSVKSFLDPDSYGPSDHLSYYHIDTDDRRS